MVKVVIGSKEGYYGKMFHIKFITWLMPMQWSESRKQDNHIITKFTFQYLGEKNLIEKG